METDCESADRHNRPGVHGAQYDDTRLQNEEWEWRNARLSGSGEFPLPADTLMVLIWPAY